MKRIIYIAGYGRSGSTLLEMVLALHHDVFGAGELIRILDLPYCGCGQSIIKCDYWQTVFAKLNTFPEDGLAELRTVTQPMENNLGVLLGLQRQTDSLAQYRQLWGRFILGLLEASDKNIIVDSSKTTRLVYSRPLLLSSIPEFDLRIIHLVRDPRAVMWSYMRGSNPSLEEGNPYVKRGGAIRALMSWAVSNMVAEIVIKRSNVPSIRVRYEDLVDRSEWQVQRLESVLELNLSMAAAALTNHSSVPLSGHSIGGNRVRRKGVSEIKLDSEWENALPLYLHAMAKWVLPLAVRYGYAV